MSTKFSHTHLTSTDRRTAAIVVYWIALGVAALILAFAIREDAGAHLPYLAGIAPSMSSNETFCAA